jgi:hypothetical protein
MASFLALQGAYTSQVSNDNASDVAAMQPLVLSVLGDTRFADVWCTSSYCCCHCCCHSIPMQITPALLSELATRGARIAGLASRTASTSQPGAYGSSSSSSAGYATNATPTEPGAK